MAKVNVLAVIVVVVVNVANTAVASHVVFFVNVSECIFLLLPSISIKEILLVVVAISHLK